MKRRRFRVEYGSCTHKLLIACILAGEYPYESLGLINVSRVAILRSINVLSDDFGYITIKKRNKSKKVILRLWDRNKSEYAEDVFRGASEYVPELKISKPAHIQRKDRIAELIIMCLEAGIHVTPDEKPCIAIPKEKSSTWMPYLLTSVELRKAAPVKEDRGKGARFHGLIISNGGAYIVYNMGMGLMDWVRPAEYNAIQMMQVYVTQHMPWFVSTHTVKESIPPRLEHNSIVFTGNYMYAVDFVKGKISEIPTASAAAQTAAQSASAAPDRPAAQKTSVSTPAKKKRTGKNLFNISDYYDNTYFLPLDYCGQTMLNIMTKPDWHYYLTGLFYPDAERLTPEESLSIGCDGKSDGNYGLVFLDGNITRLKRFLSIPLTESTKGHLKIICFDFQKEAVEAVAPNGFDVISYDFDMIVQGFYEVYEKYCSANAENEDTPSAANNL